MKELIGKHCRCVFNLPHNEWPIAGYPAWVDVIDVDMPMVSMKSSHCGNPLWVNAAIIKTIEPLGSRKPWKSIGEDELGELFDALPDGRNGFLKTWGYVTFARAVEGRARELNGPTDD